MKIFTLFKKSNFPGVIIPRALNKKILKIKLSRSKNQIFNKNMFKKSYSDQNLAQKSELPLK